MNILYTITRYWPAIGGAETHVRQVATTLAARHTVHIAAHTNAQQVDPVRHSTVDTDQAHEYEDGTTRIHLLGATSGQRMWVRPSVRLYQYSATKNLGYKFYASVFTRKLLDLIRTHKIDLIHNVLVGTEYLSHVSCQVARAVGIPFVITPLVHEGIWGDGAFFFRVYRQADAVVALLNVERQLYLDHGIQASHIHTIGVSPVIAKNSDPLYFIQKFHIPPGKIVLFVGRQVPSKGHRALLKAAPMIWARHPDTSLVFVGPSEESDDAFDEIKDRRIFNLGSLSDEDKTSAIAACTVFCLPSVGEIMPTVFLEAWHFGKPVIGGDIPTLRELIRDGEDGFVVEQEPEKIAMAVTALLKDPKKAKEMGAAGQQKVHNHYTAEQVAGQLEGLYQNLLVRKG